MSTKLLNKAFYFDADFEQRVMKGQKFSYLNSKENREFEYFILISEKTPLFSKNKFDHRYLKFLEETFHKEVNVTEKAKRIIPWCGAQGTNREIVSKKTAAIFNKEVLKVKSIVINPQSFRTDKLYIIDGFYSGIGHCFYPKDAQKLSRCIERFNIIENNFFTRVKDFSTLFLAPKKRVSYENIVDDRFQYRGSFFGALNLPDEHKQKYESDLNKIEEYYKSLDITYPFSIDSFLYLEKNEIKLYSFCEVNARKSMGYIAYKLGEFFKAEFALFYLSRDLISNKSLRSVEGLEKIIMLAPPQSFFKSYFFIVSDEKSLGDLKAQLCRSS